MQRPTVTREMKLVAAREIAAKLDGDADAIADAFERRMDGYELARELDRRYGWDLTMRDVEELDEMDGLVQRQLVAAEKAWVAEHAVAPTLPVGTRIKQGVIAGVSEHSAARYKVKEDGDTDASRFLLVRFEDAIAV